MPGSALTHPLLRSSRAPSFCSTSGACRWISYPYTPNSWYCYWIQNNVHGPVWILLLLLNIFSILPLSFQPLSFFPSLPLLVSPPLPPRWSQQLTIYTLVWFCSKFCLLKGSFSSPLFPTTYSGALPWFSILNV